MLLGMNFLDSILKQRQIEDTNLADSLQISSSNVSMWRTKNKIPSRRASQIAEVLGLSSQDLDRLLGVEPLKFCLRTRNKEVVKEVKSEETNELTRFKIESIFEKFFNVSATHSRYDLTALKNQIRNCGENFKAIADSIRKEFVIPDYLPLTYDCLVNQIQDRIGISAFYLPFKSIGLSQPERDGDPTAILFNRDNRYYILVDSERTIDEAHFDKVHEVVHILVDNVLPENPNTEKLIDKICGELIYPSTYILEKFFNGDRSSRPFTQIEKVKEKFYEDLSNFKGIISPKGLARAMRDTEFTSESSELYKYMYYDFHAEFREKNYVTCSKIGHMDFDFSKRDLFLKFYDEVVLKDNRIQSRKYPLFRKLRDDLISGQINPQDLSQIFSLKLADSMIIKAIWLKQEQKNHQ